MNQVVQSILDRRSVRCYRPDPVPEEDLVTLAALGQLAPTAMDYQAWHFSIVTNQALLGEIKENCRRVLTASPVEAVREMAQDPDFDPFWGAPCVIFISGGGSEWAVTDCANAATTMVLAAQAMGLNTCYLSGFLDGFRDRELQKKVGVPEGYEPFYALALGYGNEEPYPRSPRKAGAVNYVK